MTTITIDRAVVEQALHVAESAGYPVALIKALRAALAQQAEPVEPAFHGFMSDDGTQVDVCFSPSAPRRDGTYATAYYTAPPQQVAQQAEPLNLRDPAVQKRLAAQWGYVPAAQAEPVEPVAGVVLNEEGRAALVEYGREEWHCVVRNARRLYTAPPKDEPKPMHPELRKMWEDYFDKCFRAMPVPKQAEPVGWNWMLDGQPYGQAYYGNPPDTDIAERAATAGRTVRLLYTAPPQRTMVPLTEEEIMHIGMTHQSLRQVVRAVERAHGIKEN